MLVYSAMVNEAYAELRCPPGQIINLANSSQCIPNPNGGISGTSSTSGPSGCQFDENQSVSEMLSNDACKPNHVITASDYTYEGGARERIIEIANQIIFVGSLVSVGAIVYAGFILVTAVGDDEKIKNGKNSLKFGIIGFVIMLISFPLVNAIVDIFYTIGA